MKTFFMISFAVAALAEVVVVAMLVLQAVRQKPHMASDRAIVRVNEVVAAASLFGGSMVISGVITHGWGDIDSTDLLLFAATFGVVTAALIERVRTKTTVANAAYAIPVGFGVIAGLVGSSL
ncbi:hypothetical protein ABZ654_26425 [Streptomyces hygroscopicus]|uniref:hypothetical protein n=1 Tax=Streptomyces hygroscopicus TaxID=1912 RepID=UPI0033F0187D